MKFNPGYITKNLNESKTFYTKFLDFKVKFENEFYLLLEHISSNESFEISFLMPNHPSQEKFFQKEYTVGSYLTIEVMNVDEELIRLKKLNCKIEMDIKDEPWGDRHFVIQDPSGLYIDIVTYEEKSL